MKTLKIYLFFFLALTIISLTAFKPKKENKSIKIKAPAGWCYIPAGTIQLDKDRSASSQAFYMLQTEVSNAQYQSFLSDIKNSGRLNEYQVALYDSVKWKEQDMEALTKFYYSNSAFKSYPVAAVSRKGAELYCLWLEDKMNKELPEGIKVKVRLPSEFEWMYAASGGRKATAYPWGGPSTRNSKGLQMANFTSISDDRVRRNPETNKIEILSSAKTNSVSNERQDVTTPVKSYYPNDYGLYNMSGNVAELVAESGITKGGSWNSMGNELKILVVEQYSEQPSTLVGFRPVFTYLSR